MNSKRSKLSFILGLALVGVLLAVAIPNFVKARVVASKNSCLENLKQIEAAKLLWATERQNANSTVEPPARELFGPAKYMREVPTCFLNGTYSIGNMSQRPRCSVPEHTL